MREPRSEWLLTASCSPCHGLFSITSTAVLLRDSLFGPRGVVIDVLGERWPEPGQLFHPRCFVQQFGRRPLWTSFVRGRFDNGLAMPVLQKQRPGQHRVYHLRCFVDTHSRAAAYALLGQELWRHVPRPVKRLGGAIIPFP